MENRYPTGMWNQIQLSDAAGFEQQHAHSGVGGKSTASTQPAEPAPTMM